MSAGAFSSEPSHDHAEGSRVYTLPPLQWDQERDEPYLEIQHRGEQYFVTMWRESDGDDMVRNWNHPLVGQWSFRRPYPYTHAHLPETLDMFLRPDRQAIPTYRGYGNEHEPKVVPSLPPTRGRYLLRSLRTDKGKMIGNLDLFDCGAQGIGDGDGDKDAAEENRRGLWEIAYDLDPDYWGKGLGGAMVAFLVDWAGVTGVKVISAKVNPLNKASERVLAKNGFELKYKAWNDLPADKGPGAVEFGYWERTL